MATDSEPMSTDSDLITSFPDDVLHRFLGLLNTKQAVQTCVLSKRWEHLWTFLPSLDLNDGDFESDVNDANGEGGSARFIKFVNKLLQKWKSLDLDMFVLSGDEFRTRYKCYSDWYEFHITEWISYAVKHKARVIYLIDLPYKSLPSCIYTCASIEELNLSTCHRYAYGMVHLPNLRKLSIYDGIGCLRNLLSGSPNLEYLKLDLCSLEHYLICHGFLKHLSIIDCEIYYDTRLLIAAPKLLSFSYRGEVPLSSKETLSMPSLVSADIKICYTQMTDISEKLAPLLSALGNVEHLKLDINRCMLTVCISYIFSFHK